MPTELPRSIARRAALILVLVSALVALAGCGSRPAPTDARGDSGPVGTGATARQNIGPTGGAVSLEGTTLTVPPGAVGGDHMITVTSSTEPAPMGYAGLSPVYRFGPDGLVFAQPVSVTMTFEGDPSRATVFWSRLGAPGYDRLGGAVSGNRITVAVTHFSDGFVGDGMVTPPDPADGGPDVPVVQEAGADVPADAANDTAPADVPVAVDSVVADAVADAPATDVPAADAAADAPAVDAPVCTSPTTLCGASCVDTRSSPAHCGRCDGACAAGETCAMGACVPPVLLGVAITPASVTVPLGAVEALTARGSYADGSTQDVTSRAAWSSSDPSVALIDPSGRLIALAAGTTRVQAVVAGVSSADATVTVTSATPVSVAVSPASTTIAVGLTAGLTAFATYTDGTTRDVSAMATWTSSAASVASAGAGGRVTGVAPGTATVRASLGALSSTPVTVTVTAATLVRLDAVPSSLAIPVGTTGTLAVSGAFSDGTSSDVTATAAWSTGAASVATVSAGTVAAVATGTTDVTASFGGRSVVVPVRVTAAAPVGVSVRLDAASIAIGTTTIARATASFSDGTTRDVSAMAAWTSSATGTAVVFSPGTVEARGAGAVTITALFGAVMGDASLTVTSAALTRIEIVPAATTLPLGTTSPLVALGFYTDGSVQTLTHTALWSASAPATASVDAHGTVRANAIGTSVVTATMGGVVSPGATITVSAARLDRIDVTPPSASIAVGETTTLAATGYYSDGTSAPVTSGAVWTSSNVATATVGIAGVVRGISTGAVTVTVVYQSVSATASVAVTPAVVIGVFVSPPSASVAAGRTQPLNATVAYSDGRTAPGGPLATWTSNAPGVAAVSASGVVTGLAPGGPATITATVDGVGGSASITVTPAVVIGVFVSPPSASVAAGRTRPLSATAIYSDGTSASVSSMATWSSGDPGVATVDTSGVVAGVAVGGPVTITATFGGSSGTVGVTVTPGVLDSLTLSSGVAPLPEGSSRQVTAMGFFSDGTSRDVTSDPALTWSSSNPSAASVSNSAATRGVVTATGSGGTVTITASSAGVTGTTNITVTAAEVLSIELSPAITTLTVFTTRGLTASGTFTDSSVQDITPLVSWSSSDPSVATVDSSGVVTGVALGPVTITATQATSVGPVSNSLTFDVTP